MKLTSVARLDLAGSVDSSAAARAVAYLDGGSVLAAARGAGVDRITQEGNVVPLIIKTDGQWVWPMAVSYYLTVHGVPLEDAFLAHVLQMPEGPAPQASEDAVRKGLELLKDR